MKNDFGLKIRELRKKKKINQTQMAEILGVHLQTICRYETGKLTPSPEILSILAEKFDVDVNWLFANDQVPVVESPGVDYAVDNDVREMLQRILNEGDPSKMPVLRSMLAALDPGKK